MLLVPIFIFGTELTSDQLLIKKEVEEYDMRDGVNDYMSEHCFVESSYGLNMINLGKLSNPYDSCVGIMQVGVLWVTIEIYGEDWTLLDYLATQSVLLNNNERNLYWANKHIQRGKKKFEYDWWRWAWYKWGNKLKNPDSKYYASAIQNCEYGINK